MPEFYSKIFLSIKDSLNSNCLYFFLSPKSYFTFLFYLDGIQRRHKACRKHLVPGMPPDSSISLQRFYCHISYSATLFTYLVVSPNWCSGIRFLESITEDIRDRSRFSRNFLKTGYKLILWSHFMTWFPGFGTRITFSNFPLR